MYKEERNTDLRNELAKLLVENRRLGGGDSKAYMANKRKWKSEFNSWLKTLPHHQDKVMIEIIAE